MWISYQLVGNSPQDAFNNWDMPVFANNIQDNRGIEQGHTVTDLMVKSQEIPACSWLNPPFSKLPLIIKIPFDSCSEPMLIAGW